MCLVTHALSSTEEKAYSGLQAFVPMTSAADLPLRGAIMGFFQWMTHGKSLLLYNLPREKEMKVFIIFCPRELKIRFALCMGEFINGTTSLCLLCHFEI